MIARVALLTAAACLTALSGLPAQERGGVSILSPPPDAYVTGPLLIQARVGAPAASVRQVTFFADGRSVCTIIRPPWECAWDAGAGLREHVIRVVATLASGERLVETVRTRAAGYVETVDVDAVQVTVVVTDQKGQFVKKLTRDQFTVKEDGVRQRLAAFAGDNIPLEIVVAIDVSQSMTDAMDVLKAAVRRFLSELRPQDQVTLLAFNDNIFTLARRSVDPEARLRAVDRLAPWGGTALYDVILTALNTVGKQPGRRALVVFTDGEDQSSVSTLKRVEDRLETSDATVYTIGLGRSTRDQELAAILTRLSDVSGGRSFSVDRIERLEGAFAEIVEELSNQYLLSYASTNEKRDGTWRKIDVEVADKAYKVRHRQGYRVPGPRREQGSSSSP